MLCYQSSRNATDIIHDTFEWLTANRRALIPLLIPVAAVCALCIPYMGYDIDIDRMLYNSHYIFDLFSQLINPDETTPFVLQDRALAIGALAGATTLMTVPLLRHYFIDRRSVCRLTYKGTYTLTLRHLWHALPCALLIAVSFYLWEYLPGWWLVPIYPVVTLILPCLIMSRTTGLGIKFYPPRIILTLIYIYIVVFAIKALPAIIFALFTFAVQMTNELVPGIMPDSHLVANILTAIVNAVICLSYSMAVVVYIVSALMLHGAIVTRPDHEA